MKYIVKPISKSELAMCNCTCNGGNCNCKGASSTYKETNTTSTK